ncbi:MAG: hypothetical protein DAHOPDDO_00833 [Ignavibacteriaceae bacterium]|nr:hypothetical protein [Ignavibacteriaceae bacterium]
MKSVFCLLIILLLILNIEFVFAEGKSSTAKEKAKSIPSATGEDFSNESLFTGDVAFSVPITNIGGISVALNYTSNVHKLVRADNKDAQAGWVGLGWSLNLGSIVADINGTRDVSDDKYFFVSASGSSEMILISGNDFMLKEYQYWKITRSVDGNGNLIGWTIILDDGTKMRFGNYDKNTSTFSLGFTPTAATRLMLAWGNLIVSPSSSAYSSGTYVAFQWDLSDIQDIYGNHTTIIYQQEYDNLELSPNISPDFTRASYPHKIIDQTGKSVEFFLRNLTPSEYVDPDNIVQRQFQTKFLDKIVIKSSSDELITELDLTYSIASLLNLGHAKRYLTSITQKDNGGSPLPATEFEYYGVDGITVGTNTGALKTIYYPSGGKVDYQYDAVELSNVSLNSTFDYTSGTEPIVSSDMYSWGLSGTDFYVIKMADNTLRVYRWGTIGWYLDTSFPITGSVVEHRVMNDYIVVRETSSSMKVIKRKGEGWQSYTVFVDPGTPSGVLSLGSDFFLVKHNESASSGVCNISVVRWSGDSWIVDSMGTFHLTQATACGNRFFFAVEKVGGPPLWTLYYSVFTWNGSSWSKYTISVGWATQAYAGKDFFVIYDGVNEDLMAWKCNGLTWQFVYNKTDAQNFAGVVIGDNYFLHLYNRSNGQDVGTREIYVTTWQGNGWTNTNLGQLFGTPSNYFGHPRIALQANQIAIGWRQYLGTIGYLGVTKMLNSSWSSGEIIESVPGTTYPHTIYAYYNPTTLYSEESTKLKYHYYNGTSWQHIEIDPGQHTGYGFSMPGLGFIADVVDPDFGIQWNSMSHGYKEGYGATLNPIVQSSPYDYPVSTKTITDGMGNSYQTIYTFENGVYDHEINFAKYNKVTVELPQQDNGKTITYFYNHLGPGQAEEFVYALNYKELDGLPYKINVYNSAINEIATTTNYWAAYAIDASKGVYHKRLTKTVSINDEVTSSVEYEYNNTNGKIKKITEPVKVASDLYGLRDRVTEITYAYEQYTAMQALNMLSQRYESKLISKGSSSNTVAVFADGPEITDYNQFSVLYNQTVTYEAIVSGGYFCVGTTQGGDDIISKKYSDASGSFHANTGVTYYLTAHTYPCSPPPHPCEAWVIGRVTYYQSTDPDEVVISRERIEYDSGNNYIPFKTSVYDGTNWIASNTITKRNSNGNITESYNVDNVYSTIKYGYNNTLPIAQVANSKDGESGYTGLESGWQDWETGGSTIVSNLKHTGIYSAYSQNNYGPTKNFYCANGVDKNKSYLLEAWVRRTGGTGKITIELRDGNNNVLSIVSQDITGGTNWQLVSLTITPQQMTNLPSNGYLRVWCGYPNSTSNYGYIDDVRFYPADAMMTTYTYDPIALQVTSGTDENNVTTFYEYDSFGRLTQTKNDDGDVLAQTTYYISREHNGGNFNPGDPNYTRTSAYPDGIGSTPVVTTTFTDGLGRTLQQHSRDGSNDMISAVSYDNAGRMNKTYNTYSLNNPNHNFDPNYVTSSSGYIETQYYSDPLGRIQWKIPQGSSPSTPNKNIESVYGNATLNGVSCYTSDVKQKPATNSVNWITSKAYRDRLGRVVKSSVLDGSSEIQASTTLYNMLGLPVQVTDPKGMQQNYTYNFLGQLKEKTSPDAGTSKYIYDIAGRLRFMLDADGASATPDNVLYWKYDKLGRVTEKGYLEMDWGDGSTLQNYANTNPDYPTTPVTWRKKFTYDTDGVSLYLKGRLYKVETNNDNNTDVETEETFAYNKYGFVTAKNLTVMEVSTQNQSTFYEYDNLGRVAKITYPSRPENLALTDENISGTIPQQYEANNNIDVGPDVTVNSGSSLTLKAGTSIHLKPGFTAANGSNFRTYTGTFTGGGTPTEVVYTYNQRGQISGVGTTTNPTFYASYTYKPSGQIETEILNNGQRQVQTTYDVKNRPTQISSPLFTETLTYETGGYGGVGYYHGNIASANFSYYSGGPAAYQTLYQYDNLGRLKIADNSITALNPYDISNISYDLNGNIISINKGGTNYTYNYYNATNKLKNTGGSAEDYVYDANGNITASLPKGLNPLVYDPFTQMTKGITVSGTPTHTVNFQYTADNERILKNEKQATTNNLNLYIRGASEYPVIEKINTDNTLTDKIYIYGPTGLIAFKDATATYFVIKDHLGSTRILFRSTGTQYTTYDYSPFGSLMRSSISGDVVYKFTGQEYDSETGLYNFRARFYDDELGIFYAVDPSGQNFSPFSYAGNNPIIFVDENGRWFGIDDLVAAIIGGVVNLGVNLIQGNVHGWDALGYFGAGAAAGTLALYGPAGWAAGGAIVGASNSALGGAQGWDILTNAAIGGISGIAGGYAASWASANLGGVIVNGLNINANSAIAGGIYGSVGGVGGAFGGGFTTGLITTGDIGSAFEMGISGIPLGLTTGGIAGFSSNISRNVANNRNWFTGTPNNNLVIGEGMTRVNAIAQDIKSRTIGPDWPENLNPYEQILGEYKSNPEGLKFNRLYLEYQMRQNTTFYDAGYTNGISPYYNMETGLIYYNNYQNIYNIRPFYNGNNLNIYFFYK